jgi:hypothetical protein
MVLIPAMHNLAIPVVIPMAFVAVLFVTVAIVVSILVIYILVAMFIVTAPVSMTLPLGKNHPGA